MAFEFQPQQDQPVVRKDTYSGGIGKSTIIVFALFFAVILGVVLWHPVVNGAKGMWARYCARDAIASLEADDLGHAIAQIISAREWAPEDPEVIGSIIAYLKTVQGNPHELAYQLRLLNGKKPLSIDNQILYGATLLSIGQIDEARRIYDALPKDATSTPEGLAFFGKLRAAEGQTSEGAGIARKSLMLQKDTPEARLALAVQDKQHSFPEFRRQAWADLWELAKLDSPPGLDAMMQISKDARLRVDQAEQLLELVEKHPSATLQSRLAIVTALIRLQPDQRERRVEEEIERFQKNKSGSLEHIAAWLSENGEHSRLLALIPTNLAKDSRTLYTSLVKALVVQGRWAEFKAMLQERRPPVSEELAAIWMADVESHLQSDRDEPRRHLTFAVDSAKANSLPEELELAAALSERLGMLDLAIKANLTLAELVPPRQTEILKKTREVALLAQDTHALLDISRKLQELHPTSGCFTQEFNYLRLLLGEQMESVDLASLQREADHRGATPSSVRADCIPLRLLEALAAYRFSNKAAVVRHMNNLPPVEGLSAGYRAVLAGLLATSGQEALAFQIAEKVPESLLLAEERAFLLRAK